MVSERNGLRTPGRPDCTEPWRPEACVAPVHPVAFPFGLLGPVALSHDSTCALATECDLI